MAKLTVKSRDGEAATGDAPRLETNKRTVTDTLGRVLKVQKPSALQRMRVLDAIGGASASNSAYLGQVMLAVSCVQIDDDPVPFPQSKRQIEALVERLGDEGLDVTSTAIAEIMGIELDPETGEVRHINPDTTKDRAKN